MKKQFAALILAILPAFTFAAGPEAPLDKVDIDLTDKAAMQDGLKTFANYCMGCHSAKFQRYERVASDLGIPEEVMMDNIVFADAKFGDHMSIGMKPEDAKDSGSAPLRRISPWLLVFVATTGCIPTCAASMKIRRVRTASTTACSPMLVCRMFWLRSRVAGLSDVSRSKWSRMAASSSIL